MIMRKQNVTFLLSSLLLRGIRRYTVVEKTFIRGFNQLKIIVIKDLTSN